MFFGVGMESEDGQASIELWHVMSKSCLCLGQVVDGSYAVVHTGNHLL